MFKERVPERFEDKKFVRFGPEPRSLIERLRNDPRQDVIYIQQGVSLPSGISIDALKEALTLAKKVENQESFGLRVFVVDILDKKRPSLCGYFMGRTDIGISVRGVIESSKYEGPVPWYDTAPADQQFWSTAFEEALHAARRATGKDIDPYYRPSPNHSLVEFHKYNSQPIEAVVNETLNSGILKMKFGPTALYLWKRVVHYNEAKFQALSGMAEEDLDEMSEEEMQELVDRMLIRFVPRMSSYSNQKS
jgi:hypothetical protein